VRSYKFMLKIKIKIKILVQRAAADFGGRIFYPSFPNPEDNPDPDLFLRMRHLPQIRLDHLFS